MQTDFFLLHIWTKINFQKPKRKLKIYNIIQLILQAIKSLIILLNQFRKNNLSAHLKMIKIHNFKDKPKIKNQKLYKDKKFTQTKISSNYY